MINGFSGIPVPIQRSIAGSELLNCRSQRRMEIVQSLSSMSLECNPFCKLPPELRKFIICQFLITHDIVRLESAFCNNAHHAAYNELLVGMEIKDNIRKHVLDHRRLWEWKMKHKVVVRSLFCGQRLPHARKCTEVELIESWLHSYLPRTTNSLLELFLYLDDVSASLIEMVATNCPILETIHLIKTGKIHSDRVPPSVAPITTHCQALRRIRVEGCTFDEEAALSVGTNLEVLHISHYQEYHLPPMLSRCTKLTKLHVTKFDRVSWAMNPACYLAIGSHLPNIQVLRLSSNLSCMQGIDALFGCPRLRVLECARCTGLTADILCGLLCIPSLRVLKLSICPDFNCVVPEVHTVLHSQLICLSLDLVTDITDDGLASVTARCPALRRLTVTGARELTVGAVDSVFDSCKNMQVVNFNACPHLQLIEVDARVASADRRAKIVVGRT